jgi:hypothetical protein
VSSVSQEHAADDGAAASDDAKDDVGVNSYVDDECDGDPDAAVDVDDDDDSEDADDAVNDVDDLECIENMLN